MYQIIFMLQSKFMQNQHKQLSRKTFLSWTAGIGSLLAIPAFLRFPKKKPESKTVKMLTQDGTLVMIDVNNIPTARKKAVSADIHNWVRTKRNSQNKM